MFLLLVGARLRMLRNTARSAPRWQQVVIGVLSLFSLALFLGIAAACGALVIIAQNGIPATNGLTPGAQALVGRTEEYLFFFLLAGSIPFVAATLFQADDMPLLLTTPLRPRVIVAAKLLDAAVVNAAQFLFLGVPVLAGLGWATAQGVGGWLWLLVATVLLLALPPAITALLLLVTARVVGLRRVRLGVMLVSVALGLGVTTLAVLGASRAVRTGALDLPRLEAALHGDRTAAMPTIGADTAPRWLPSAWAGTMLIETAGGRSLGRAGWTALGLLAGITILLVVCCIEVGQSVLASEGVLEQETRRGGRHGNRSPRLWGVPAAVSGLLVKDQKYLTRDLILLGQIGTALILFLVPFLLKAAQGSDGTMDADLYGGLILAMLGVIVYMVTSIVSLSSVGLEGRGFWLVLTSPVSRGRFLRAKWLGAFLVSAGVVTLLTPVAWRAFALPAGLVAGAWAGYLVACAALSGLGVGLAGLFPRFVYENPAHRASVSALVLGFVLATGYILVCSLEAAGLYAAVIRSVMSLRTAEIVGISAFMIVSVLTGLVPVLIAERRLNNYDWEF
jgi:ABC-2 type transport system permease protein